MLKLLFITYYGLREALLCAAQALQRKQVEVSEFPLFRWSSDHYDKRDDYLEMLDQEITRAQADVVLFWCLSLSTENLKTLRARHEQRTFALFNWDDPYCWQSAEMDIIGKSACFDLVFTCCEDSIADYLAAGAKEARWLPPAFDPAIHRPLLDAAYACDVSLCATQLYDKDQVVSRYQVAKALDADPEINFRLYGPDRFAAEFPHSYAGFVLYAETAKVYSNSRINICTHVTSRTRYVNERVMLVCGSGGLALVDPVPGFEEVFSSDEYVQMEPHRVVEQIRELLAGDSNRLQHIRDAGRTRALRDYTWDHWAEQVFLGLVETRFDAALYASQLDEGVDDDAFTHWLTVGRAKSLWPIKLLVPEDFQWRQYCALNGLPELDREAAWLHWRKQGQAEGALMPSASSANLRYERAGQLPLRCEAALLAALSNANGSVHSIDEAVNFLLQYSEQYSGFQATRALRKLYEQLDSELSAAQKR